MKTTDLNQSEKTKKMCRLQVLQQAKDYNGTSIGDMEYLFLKILKPNLKIVQITKNRSILK